MSDSLQFVEWDRAGETLVGTVVEIRKGKRFPGRQTFVAEIETKSETVALVLSRILEVKFREEGIRRGHRVKVRYRGERRSANGRLYRDFSVKSRAS